MADQIELPRLHLLEAYQIRDSAEEIPTVEIGEHASFLLANALVRRIDPDDKRTRAVCISAVMVLRSYRALAALYRLGYEPEASPMHRRMIEGYDRVNRYVAEPNGGQQADAWIDGTGDWDAAKFSSYPQDVRSTLHWGAHADPRGIVATDDGEIETLHLVPHRDIPQANKDILHAIGLVMETTTVVCEYFDEPEPAQLSSVVQAVNEAANHWYGLDEPDEDANDAVRV